MRTIADCRSILLGIYIKRGMDRVTAQELVNGQFERQLYASVVKEVRIELINALVLSGKNEVHARSLVEKLSTKALFDTYLKKPQQEPVVFRPDANENHPRLNHSAVLSQSIAEYDSISESDQALKGN